MRICLLVLLLCLAPGLAVAVEKKRLPDFFDQSFDAVKDQPLATLPAGRSDETGAIAREDVPVPPPRLFQPAETRPIVVKKRAARRRAPRVERQGVVIREQGGVPAMAAVRPQPAPGTPPAIQPPSIAMLGTGDRPAAAAVPALGAPFALKVPANVRVGGATRFSFDDRTYELAGTERLGVSQKCLPDKNGRCVRHPMRALKEAIAGRTLQCRAALIGQTTRLSCTR